VTDRDRVLRLIRRVRAALEAVRLVQGAARGALAGGGIGLLVLVATKALPAWSAAPELAWALLGAGTVVGLLVAAVRPRISLAAAALFLDRRLAMQERFVTVLTRPADPFTTHVVAELAARHRLPRLPFPREVAVVPAALFLLFAAGLLPEAGAPPAAPGFTVVVDSSGAGTEVFVPPLEIGEEGLRRLEQGAPPADAEAVALREALEHRVHRPEDRRAAHAALERALQGDAAAAREVARTIRATREAKTGGLTQVVAYPEAEEFLREYRRARAEEGR
jgi:hypothetical protein